MMFTAVKFLGCFLILALLFTLKLLYKRVVKLENELYKASQVLLQLSKISEKQRKKEKGIAESNELLKRQIKNLQKLIGE